MLRRKNDSMRDMPKDVRHSLQILDGLLDGLEDDSRKSPASTLRHVPVDARRSLEILDNVIVQFEEGEHKTGDNFGVQQNEVAEEVSKSLEALDQVLDEFQSENGVRACGRKQTPADQLGSLHTSKHEDVRRSLEVLDSVLAEFDDCLEAWDTLGQDTTAEDGGRDLKLRETFGKNYSSFSFDNCSTDGNTSHDSGVSLQEQIRISSPPPVPKRSSTTKLSDRGSGVFNFQFSDSQSIDSLHSETSTVDNDLSETNYLSAQDNNEVFEQNQPFGHCCTKCGTDIEPAPIHVQVMEPKDASSSPFSERRKMFENLINESTVPPLMERSFNGSSFKVRSGRTKDCESEPSSLVYFRSVDIDPTDSGHSSFSPKYSPKATKVTPPRVDGLLSLPNTRYHAPNCNCKQRILLLQQKFAETIRLLKANKIKRLVSKPPSFVPPPPPVHSASRSVLNPNSNGYLSRASPKNLISRSYKDLRVTNGSTTSVSSEDNSLSSAVDSEINSRNGDRTGEQKLCKRCSLSTDHLPLSETIEDLPKLLPTDALLRPQLGLSYSLEDDLSPGVKEILQSPFPRNGILGPSRKTKTTSLSTFSLSTDSSLGYASSQSDYELSNSPKKLDKVPVSTLKFSTLPEGMDLHSLPSYYGQEQNGDRGVKANPPLFRDRNFNHTSDPQLRSSSAPPEPEKPKKGGIFRGFSRKNKKEKEKKSELIQGKVS